MSQVLTVLRTFSIKSYVLMLVATVIFLLTILANVGFIDSLYSLTEYMVYPRSNTTSHYIVISSYSAAPFTSAFNIKFVEEKLRDINGVKEAIYEVLTIIEYESSSYVLRGVDRNELHVVTGYYRFIGDDFDEDCINCVWVGLDLAEKLGININDTIIVYSPFTLSNYLLHVKGLIETDGPLRYEFLASIDTARSIRGIYRNGASIAIIFLKNKEDMYRIPRKSNKTTTEKGLFERALLALKVKGKQVSVSTYESLSNMYLSRFGLSKDLLFALLFTVMFLLCLGFYMFGQSLVIHDIDKFTILYEQGLSISMIRLHVMLFAFMFILLAGFISSIIAEILFPHVRFNVLGYERSLVFDRDFLYASLIVNAFIIAVGVWSVKIYDESE